MLHLSAGGGSTVQKTFSKSPVFIHPILGDYVFLGGLAKTGFETLLARQHVNSSVAESLIESE